MMRVRTVAILLMLGVAAVANAVPHPFYAQMLQRGIASSEDGNDAQAARELKIAAFGLLGELPLYQKAQVYLAIVNQRLQRRDDARIAAVKFLQAERISQAFASLDLPADVRTSFEQIAASAADPEYLASLPAFRHSAPPEVAVIASADTQAALPLTPDGAKPSAAEPGLRPTTPDDPRSPGPAPTPSFTTAILDARRILESGNRADARRAYLKLAAENQLARSEVLEVAEGLNRLGAWRESSEALRRALPWTDGDEHYMFLEAINRYEMGERKAARQLLERVLPKLPPSRELAIYRGMIEAGSPLP